MQKRSYHFSTPTPALPGITVWEDVKSLWPWEEHSRQRNFLLFEHLPFGRSGSPLDARTPLPRALWNAEMVLCKEATGHIWCRKTNGGCGGGGNHKRRKKEGQRRWKTEGRRYQGFGTWSLVPELISTSLREVKLPSVSPVLSIPILETARTHARISSPF